MRWLAVLLLALALTPSPDGVRAQSGTPAPAPTTAMPADAKAIIESERFRRLALELRCLVCQNQTLADSNAPLAQDLRNEVVRLIASGRDDPAIKTFLVDRYGEFVLYRPPVSARNALLWLGPFLLLAIGGIGWWRLGRRAPAQGPAGGAAVRGTASPATSDAAASPSANGEREADAQSALRRVDDLLGR